MLRLANEALVSSAVLAQHACPKLSGRKRALLTKSAAGRGHWQSLVGFGGAADERAGQYNE